MGIYKTIIQISIAITSAVMFTFMFSVSPLVTYAILILSLLLIMFKGKSVYLFVLLFIVLRPCLDKYAQSSLMGINIAAWASGIAILLCSLGILERVLANQYIANNCLIKRINIMLLFLTIASLLSSLNSKYVLASLYDVTRIVLLMTSFNYVYLIGSDQKRNNMVMFAIVLSSVLPLLIGMLQFFTGSGIWDAGYNRVRGFFVHSNSFAHYLLLVMYVCFYYIDKLQNRNFVKLVILCFASLVLLEFYLTYSRGTWIAFAMACLFVVVFYGNIKQKIVFLFSGVMGVLILAPKILARFSDLQSNSSSLLWRIQVWGELIHNINWTSILGKGLGSFWYDYGVMPHNDYLGLLYEVGPIGVISYASIIGYLVYFSWIHWRKSESRAEKSRYFILCSMWSSVAIVGIATNLFRSVVVLMYFFVVTAALLSKRKDALYDTTRK